VGVWDRLVSQDLTTRPQPMLAEHWEVSPDFTQVTLHIRHGVRFHTGRELTSQDVTKILAESPRLQLWDECHACPTSTAAYWL
jgi:MarR-like DNA-binding transcriptional regulator SgrR of sgrS sRNA